LISRPTLPIHYDTFGGSKEDLCVFTGETANAKAKLSKKITKSRPKLTKFWWFWGAGIRWCKKFRFLLQKAHPCPNLHCLSHFAWRSVEGSDPQSCCWKTAESHMTSHWNDVSPLTWGLHSRAACDIETAVFIRCNSVFFCHPVSFSTPSFLPLSFSVSPLPVFLLISPLLCLPFPSLPSYSRFPFFSYFYYPSLILPSSHLFLC